MPAQQSGFDPQTEKGEPAKAFCKEEMQDFLRYFVHPLAEKCIRLRARAESRMDKPPLYKCGEFMVPFSVLVDHWKRELDAAYRGLEVHAWHPAPEVHPRCYEPTDTPYFLSFDNAPTHSLWQDWKVQHLTREQMPVSLLQVIRICPKGHDVHQLVEHAIGAIKGHVARGLREAVQDEEPMETDVVWDLVQDGTSLFDASAWAKNIKRLNIALRIIAAERSETVRFCYPSEVEREFPGQAGNYAPMFVS